MELINIIVKVAAKSGQIPAMSNPGIRASASQTIDISITKPNRFKVKTRKGSERIFKIGAMPKLSRAIQKPVKAKTCHPPEYWMPGTNRAAA